ncbi:MAG: DUF5689 domain-containing protein [Prevotella sp.]|nr:DUF5689 domain-containing protein [Prevotella sp.]
MKRTIYILILSLISAAYTGCRDYDEPGPEKLYADSDFSNYNIIPIKQLKDMYATYHGNSIGNGVELLDKNAMIKGRVVSNDKSGNIYRILYIQDETGGIEVKIGTTSNYTEYLVGQTVYINLYRLTLGDYRYNLSLGIPGTSDSDYANSYLDTRMAINQHIFKGEVPKEPVDTIVVTSPDQLNDNMLGMLVRFEGLQSKWGDVTIEDEGSGRTSTDKYPSFLESKQELGKETEYTSYAFTDVMEDWKKYIGDMAVWEANGKPAGSQPKKPDSPRPGTLEYPTYAFKNFSDNVSYYGSAMFQFGEPSTKATHNLVLRSSGYSLFALKPIPVDGVKADITAIYTKYSSKSGDYIKYQLVINDLNAIQIKN